MGGAIHFKAEDTTSEFISILYRIVFYFNNLNLSQLPIHVRAMIWVGAMP